MTKAAYDDRSTAFGGRYDLLQELGANAAMSAYGARDVRTGEQVIITVLTPEFGSFIGQDRFLQTARTTTELKHDRILPVSDAGSTDGFLYIVSPAHNGISLREYLNRKRKLPVRDATRILRDVIEAISYAHERGVGHGSLSPDRVFVVGSRAVVADFCIGPWLRGRANGRSDAGNGEDLIAADVHAVGTIAYELMSGRTNSDRQNAKEEATPAVAPSTPAPKAEAPPEAEAPARAEAPSPSARVEQGPLTPSNIRISNPHGVLMPGTRPAMPPPGAQRRLLLRIVLYALVALIPVAMVLWAILKLV
jgi:eukaryotic-like serine/threonine-protein kinase